MKKQVKLRANAKINLFLDILNRREDGFHNILSVFQSISLSDKVCLTAQKVAGISITCNMQGVPVDQKNIVHKAARLFAKESAVRLAVRIDLEKDIPTEAGLGGGSADAAAVLLGMNELCDQVLTRQQLLKIAVQVGSDVPFCLTGGTGLVTGRGENIEKLKDLPPFDMLIIKPDFSISTAWAYQQFKDYKKDYQYIEEDIAGLRYNIFEDLCAPRYPQISQVKDKCRQLGARQAMMTGSGSAFFVVDNNQLVLNRVSRYFTQQNYQVYRCQAVTRGVELVSVR